jgi:threonine dehydratase
VEILEDIPEEHIDFMFFPVGGGGCGAGMCSYFKQVSPSTVMIGCEPLGSPSMKLAINNGVIEELKHINTFVDGAAI